MKDEVQSSPPWLDELFGSCITHTQTVNGAKCSSIGDIYGATGVSQWQCGNGILFYRRGKPRGFYNVNNPVRNSVAVYMLTGSDSMNMSH